MRDHLLGCTQFIPDVENERVLLLARGKPYALGIPKRVREERQAACDAAFKDRVSPLTAFEDIDHTPAGMMADFPREYDLKTMLNEAADRRDIYPPLNFWSADPVTSDVVDYIEKLVQEACGVNDLVLNANKATMRIGVDLGRPGGDMSAVAVRQGPKVLPAVAWDPLYPKPPATPKQALKVDTYPTSTEIKDFYKRAALRRVEDWERQVFEGRLKLGKLGKPTAQQ